MRRPGGKNGSSPYRLELLPTVQVFHRLARMKPELQQGELVYYGPLPAYYGIGEVKWVVGPYAAVDFRGTGYYSVHEDIIDQRYLIPIPVATMSLL